MAPQMYGAGAAARRYVTDWAHYKPEAFEGREICYLTPEIRAKLDAGLCGRPGTRLPSLEEQPRKIAETELERFRALIEGAEAAIAAEEKRAEAAFKRSAGGPIAPHLGMDTDEYRAEKAAFNQATGELDAFVETRRLLAQLAWRQGAEFVYFDENFRRALNI